MSFSFWHACLSRFWRIWFAGGAATTAGAVCVGTNCGQAVVDAATSIGGDGNTFNHGYGGSATGPAPHTHSEEDEALNLYPDPFGDNCPEMKRAIDIIRKQIAWRKTDLNPRSSSYAGHLTRLKILEKQLRRLEQSYKNVCKEECTD